VVRCEERLLNIGVVKRARLCNLAFYNNVSKWKQATENKYLHIALVLTIRGIAAVEIQHQIINENKTPGINIR
jgi:hypothetical protein